MVEWLRLKNLTSPRAGEGHGVVLELVVQSPYEVPNAARGYKTANGRLRVEFRYIDGEEPGEDVTLTKHISAVRGRYTGRLLAIEIDVEASRAGQLHIKLVQKQLEDAWSTLDHGKAAQNPSAVRRAFSTREADILNQLVTA